MKLRSLLLLLAIALPAAAQTPASVPHAGETIEVSIVNVDTVVTDKQGRRVHRLRKEDFEIYENGVRQPFPLFTAWGATLSGVSDTHHETKQFTIAAADLEKAKKNHFSYQFSVASATPYLRIALGVYDEVSKEYALNLVDLQPPPKR